ncbi:uncharacterized protein LOC109860741 [Pseudomyrmex gracilis]|uniref:uncharacterized protein LOC109860741 n=1 Tax=Pseudomyrmex gracilis TaxID=219809 RepID=UPI0009956CBA|nr:uncharacterized protein LOC109860741 [Pseudomyrmex gracilis]
MGDFNSKSTIWGSPKTDANGRALEELVAACNLVVLNEGTQHTCVRRDGKSIVDVTLASPSAARRVDKWKVRENMETLSDHRYLTMRGWVLRQLDPQFLSAAAQAAAWPASPAEPRDLRAELQWLWETLVAICDAAMPRSRGPPNQRSVYWWTDKIANLRIECVRPRNRYTRARRRKTGDVAARAAEAYAGYPAACKALRTSVAKAKAKAWDELLETIDADSWERPYKLVMGKIQLMDSADHRKS